MLEREIEKWLGQQLKRLGCLYYKFVSPSNRGVPDRIVICPDGALYFVELKRPSGQLATLQSVQLSRLGRYGQRTAHVWSMDDAQAFAAWIAARHTVRCRTVPKWEAGHGDI